MTAREGLFYFPKVDKGASSFLVAWLRIRTTNHFSCFSRFSRLENKLEERCLRTAKYTKYAKGFSREYVHSLFFWPFSASLSSFPAEALEQELCCLCRMNKRVLCGIMKRAEAPARPMICLAGFGSCLLRDMLQIM